MKQACIGVDIIEISRIREAVTRWGKHFLRRVYTDSELEVSQGKAESLAVRFAGKEAAIKALSAPGVVISWKEVEIGAETNGRPIVHLYGQALRQARELGLRGLGISLSHSRENAIAFVIGIRRDE